MVWFSLASGLNRRHKTELLRREVMASVAAPPADHPALGIGGRSIELSLGIGHEISPDAVELAAAELHSHLVAGDVSRAVLLDDAQWLLGLPGGADIPPLVRSRVVEDLKALGGS